MRIELNQDWTEFLSALISRSVRFVLVGGHALAAHAEPRFTEDLDVFVEPSLANAKRLRKALVDFGFGDVAPPAVELAKPDKVFMLGQKPYRIDILTGISGVSFDAVWDGRVDVEFVSKPLYVIGRSELIANKRASGRTKDKLDLEMLGAVKPKRPRRVAQSAQKKMKTKTVRKDVRRK